MSLPQVYRFPEHVIGDAVHTAINAWLKANDIPAANTLASSRFIVTDAIIQIEQFDMAVTPGKSVRTVNLCRDGFVKTERIFELKEPVFGFEPVAELAVA